MGDGNSVYFPSDAGLVALLGKHVGTVLGAYPSKALGYTQQSPEQPHL